MTNEELQLKIEALEKKMDLLEASATIPKSVEDAFKERLQAASISIASKTGSSEAQAVNEAGAASYTVLSVPDGFISTEIAGATYYIPYWT